MESYTQLDYESQYSYTENDIPTCVDFISTKQNFTWIDDAPIAVRVAAELKINCTGDFKNRPEANRMVGIRFWMSEMGIGPYLVNSLELPDMDDEILVQFTLCAHDLVQLFQYSLTDIFYLEVGLVPTAEFAYHSENDAWTEYNGTVSLILKTLSVRVLVTAEDKMPALAEPISTKTPPWNSTGLSNFKMMEGIDENNLIFLTEFSYPVRDIYQMTVGKTNTSHDSSWNVTLSDSNSDFWIVRDMDVQDSIITVIGMNTGHNHFILRLDSDGNILNLLNLTLPFGADIPFAMKVADTGDIYLISVLQLHAHYSLGSYELNLVKLNSSGRFQWNRTFSTYEITAYTFDLGTGFAAYDWPVDLAIFDDGVIVATSKSLTKISHQGAILWQQPFKSRAIVPDSDGHFYTFSGTSFDSTHLTRWTKDGTSVWNKSLAIEYGNGWNEYPDLQSMSVGSDGVVYLTLDFSHIFPTVTLAGFNRTGNWVSHQTLKSYGNRSHYYENHPPLYVDLEVTPDNHAYLAVRPPGMMPSTAGISFYYQWWPYQTFVHDWDANGLITVLISEVNNTETISPPLPEGVLFSITLGIVGVSVICIVIYMWSRKRNKL